MSRWAFRGLAIVASLVIVSSPHPRAAQPREGADLFQLSERCFPCHNGMTTASGAELSFGLDWSTSIMANSSRDPYWQASVRRETLDHAMAEGRVQNECAICHMPMSTYEARARGGTGQVFAHLPFQAHGRPSRFAADGVSCSVCHQILAENLGTPQSFNGGFLIGEPTISGVHPEYGPFDVTGGRMHVMRTSSAGFQPDRGDHIRSSELCASCHTLITQALGPDGRVIGALNEQTPYQEWLHSEYRSARSCQSCHMPAVPDEAPIARVLGVPRAGAARHVFVAANFLVQSMLARHHEELAVAAQPADLDAAAARTREYLQANAARVTIEKVDSSGTRLTALVSVANLGGHKLPTAYPARRAWLHLTARDGEGRVIFESGALRADGSIEGNDNDADPTRFEPHYREITRADQVQIYESILRDPAGRVTTGLLSAVGYLKDNRLLPRGFEKDSAPAEVAVVGEAATDPAFRAGIDRVSYVIETASARGPFALEVELLYQPIGFRWAHNLEGYASTETRRFVSYFAAQSSESAVRLARARTP